MFPRKIILFIYFLTFFWSCTKVSEEQLQNSFDYVPENTNLIIESKDFSGIENILNQNSIFENTHLNEHELFNRINSVVNYIPNSSGLLNFSELGGKNYFLTFIENKKATDFKLEKTNIKDSVVYEQKKIYYLNTEKELFFTQLNNLNIFSESKLIIENCIRNYTYGIEQKIDFNQLRKGVNSSSPSVYFNSNDFLELTALGFHPKQFPIFKNLFGWSAFDLKFTSQHIRLSGAYPFSNEDQFQLQLLTHQEAFETQMHAFMPMNALGAESYGIHDLKAFIQDKKKLRLSTKENYSPYLEDVIEIGKIHWKNHDALFFQSSNPTKTLQILIGDKNHEKKFRNQKIYTSSFDENIFSIYSPLIAYATPNYFTQLEEYFIFTENIDHLEEIIITYQNQTGLKYNSAFQKTQAAVSKKQHAFMVGINKNLSKHLGDFLKPTSKSLNNQLNFEDFEVGIFQVNMKSNFAYLNIEIQQPSSASSEKKAYLAKRIKPTSQIATPPQFFTNWRTRKKEIVFQDEENKLNMLDTDGGLIWSKALDERILGDLEEIDIYKNTRIQLLASTPSQLFLLDKAGNNVKPFPYQWKEAATQKTAVFDYDNLGKYRFFTAIENKLNLKDRNTKSISGFTFKPTKSDLASPPKHFSINNKDYLLIKEQNNQLHIVDRTGKQRVKFSTDVEFSNQDWFLYDNQFTSTTTHGELVQISPSGEVKISNPKFESSHFINAKNKVLVVLSENELHINEKIKKLDYGMYTAPQIFEFGEDTYISITDKQANKVYLFNEHGELLPSFPVFGSSKVDLYKDANQKINLLVQGEGNSILIYMY